MMQRVASMIHVLALGKLPHQVILKTFLKIAGKQLMRHTFIQTDQISSIVDIVRAGSQESL